jgi:hypothetical protein
MEVTNLLSKLRGVSVSLLLTSSGGDEIQERVVGRSHDEVCDRKQICSKVTTN